MTVTWIGRWLGGSVAGLVAVLMFALMAVTFFDVLGRYLFNAPILGGTEATEVILACLVFAGLPRITARDEHITIDLFDAAIPQAWRGGRDAAVYLFSAVILAVVTVVVWRLGGRIGASGAQTDILAIPLEPVAYFISVLCGAACLILLAKVFRSLQRRSNPAA